MISKRIESCRVCKSKKIDVILDLGEQPLANSLKEENITEYEIPLIVCRCQECGTVQLTEDTSPEIMFSKYVWVTGTSSTAQKYSEIFCSKVLKKLKGDNLHIIEIASNDGTFLKRFKEKGHKVIGVDPAKNIAEIANKSGIKTIAKFFNRELGRNIRNEYGSADIVIARNVIPHVPDPNDVIKGIAECMKEQGIGVIEFHWAEKIMTEIHYDSIYHEHYFYHSVESLQKLLEMNTLYTFDVETSPISGGSLVLYFSKQKKVKSQKLKEIELHEKNVGLDSKKSWDKFADMSRWHSVALKKIIETESRKGKKIIGYGASARSSTMLNYCRIDNRLINLIADKSKLKQGKLTAGTHIPITDPVTALEAKPDIVLILAWNFKEEIIEELKDKGFNGEVIIPLPFEPKIEKL